jgi:hypothetical protein
MSASRLATNDIDPKNFIINIEDMRGLPNTVASKSDSDAEHESENTGPSSTSTNHTATNPQIADDSPNNTIDPGSVPAQSTSQSPPMDEDILMTPPGSVIVENSSDPPTTQPSLPPSLSLSTQRNTEDDPFDADKIVPPSSSFNIPLTDVVLNRKKRNTPDTSRSPGASHCFIFFVSFKFTI